MDQLPEGIRKKVACQQKNENTKNDWLRTANDNFGSFGTIFTVSKNQNPS